MSKYDTISSYKLFASYYSLSFEYSVLKALLSKSLINTKTKMNLRIEEYIVTSEIITNAWNSNLAV
jgi:hypothetical protein